MAKLISRSRVKLEHAGASFIMPWVGEVTFDKNGFLEVPDDKAQALIDSTKDSWDFIIDGQQTEEDNNITEWLKAIDEATDSNLIIKFAVKAGMEPNQAAGSTDKLLKEFLKKRVKEDGISLIEMLMEFVEEVLPPEKPKEKKRPGRRPKEEKAE